MAEFLRLRNKKQIYSAHDWQRNTEGALKIDGDWRHLITLRRHTYTHTPSDVGKKTPLRYVAHPWGILSLFLLRALRDSYRGSRATDVSRSLSQSHTNVGMREKTLGVSESFGEIKVRKGVEF